ncbi:MAG: DUF1045 domain-containing protein, partial [Burkholderiaceae bacterium]
MQAYRIAAYFAPATSHPLWTAGVQWLEYDAAEHVESGRAALPMASSPVNADLTQTASRYGFHATLKPPLALTEGSTPDNFYEAARSLVANIPAFQMPRLSVQILDGFLALRPASQTDPATVALNALAETLVRGLDVFRSAEDDRQLEKRGARLSTKQTAMLEQWGYPFVMETWRFHMTLSRRLDQLNDRPERELAKAREHFAAALEQPLWCQDVCLF